ncbi:P-loop containing nucleoside triphosphate hydrolase protein [Scheffersomyces amazonensis]|uniref:P-loop containing nucleoside triphosphate hydrolase protein n=1 Tax=Scheffersomyces amazonensis TaxID=1078765 RepID=UPI00315DBC79
MNQIPLLGGSPFQDLKSNRTESHCSLVAIIDPLYNNESINPCFIRSLIFHINVLISIIGLFQLLGILFKRKYGKYKIPFALGNLFSIKNVGLLQLFKISTVVFQLTIYIILYANVSGFLNLLGVGSTILCITLVILPLQIIQPSRNVISCASVLLYWILSTFINITVLMIDRFFKYKVYTRESGSNFIILLELILFINSCVIYVLEFSYYRPTEELLELYAINGWNLNFERNIFNELTFSWLKGIIEKAHNLKSLEHKDVPPIPSGLDMNSSYNDFEKNWSHSLKSGESSLAKSLLRTHILRTCFGATVDISQVFFGFAQTFLFQRFIICFELAESTQTENSYIVGIAIATGMFLCTVLRYFLVNIYYSNYYSIKCKLQGSLTNMVYRKSLKLSPNARKEKTTGEIVNNLSIDVNTLSELPKLVELVTGFIKIVLTLLFLTKILGVSALSGFICASILVPITTMVSTSISSLYNKIMNIRDERTKLTSEILSSIKIVKLYSWEQSMTERLFQIRNNKELPLGKRIGIFNALSMFLWSLVPFFVPCACFITFAYVSSIPLVPAICFPALSLFDILSFNLLILPDILSQFVETKVSLKRLEDLFLLEELESTKFKNSYGPLEPNETLVKVNDGDFLWSSEKNSSNQSTEDFALKGINFEAKNGELTCIVGKTGSGKTSLLRCFLGEIPIKQKSGSSVSFNGSIAYCSQSPWIINASVKENILFGYKYNKKLYWKTLEACQLVADLEVLPDGDKTIVGEKGISLSGGQKARLALARAVYSGADIYILDDILSAVDAHVGKNIIDRVIGPQGLLNKKCIILATNSIKVLKEANNIILLKDGRIVETGNYQECKQNNGELTSLIEEFGHTEEQINETTSEVLEHTASYISTQDDVIRLDGSNAAEENLREHNIERRGSQEQRRLSMVSLEHNYEDDDGVEEEHEIEIKADIHKEKSNNGGINFSVYLQYFKACNIWSILFYALTHIGTMLALISSNYVLKNWSEENLKFGYNASPSYYLSLYSGLGITGGLFVLVGCSVLCIFSVIRASKYFHDTMWHKVLRSPMSFFEVTPVGRILNRFSDDINLLDDQLIWSWIGLANYVIEAFGFLTVVIYNLPIMVVVIVILFFIYNSIRMYFIPASRELKRLTSVSKSPIFSHLQESVIGVETIRAYEQEERFINNNIAKGSLLLKTMYASLCCSRWLSLRLQMMSSIMIYCTALSIVFTIGTTYKLTPGLVGFVMISELNITALLNSIIRCWAEVETKSVAVERIIEYCKLESEADSIIESYRPNCSWPNKGAISFNNYSTKYRDNLEPVLHNLSFTIKPQEKIGIVGRTGAGKSTIAISIFRIIEAYNGNIEIDDINTSSIGLYDLRSKLNIIPQDSQTIEGSIRQNLDPFENHSDEELWKALEYAHLKNHVEKMKTPKKNSNESSIEYDVSLSATVYEGGSNLSSGQKQLLSLARALLNKSNILILDEATAAVDVQTDQIIQDTIRSKFKDKTIITIAHRLETILDSDRIIVLDKGNVKEFDTPQNLLNDKSSEFYSLCSKASIKI